MISICFSDVGDLDVAAGVFAAAGVSVVVPAVDSADLTTLLGIATVAAALTATSFNL